MPIQASARRIRGSTGVPADGDQQPRFGGRVDREPFSAPVAGGTLRRWRSSRSARVSEGVRVRVRLRLESMVSRKISAVLSTLGG